MTLSAVGPIIEESIGTGRHPTTCKPSSSTMASMRAAVLSAASVSFGRNAMPTP